MSSFQKKGDPPQPVAGSIEQNRFDRIRKLAAEKRRKSDTDGTWRRDRRATEVNRVP